MPNNFNNTHNSVVSDNNVTKERLAVIVINKAIKSCIHPIQLSGVMGMVAGFITLYPGSKYFDAIIDKIQFRRREIKRITK